MLEPGVATPDISELPSRASSLSFFSFHPCLVSRCPHFSPCSFPSHLRVAHPHACLPHLSRASDVFPSPLLFYTRQKHIVRRNVHPHPHQPARRILWSCARGVALSLFIPPKVCSSNEHSDPWLHSAASRFAIVFPRRGKRETKNGRGTMIGRKKSPLVEEMSVNDSRTLSLSIFPSFALSSTESLPLSGDFHVSRCC